FAWEDHTHTIASGRVVNRYHTVTESQSLVRNRFIIWCDYSPAPWPPFGRGPAAGNGYVGPIIRLGDDEERDDDRDRRCNCHQREPPASNNDRMRHQSDRHAAHEVAKPRQGDRRVLLRRILLRHVAMDVQVADANER